MQLVRVIFRLTHIECFSLDPFGQNWLRAKIVLDLLLDMMCLGTGPRKMASRNQSPSSWDAIPAFRFRFQQSTFHIHQIL